MGDADRQGVTGADQNFAVNVRHYREQIGLSQEELAQRMSERGFGFTQATVWKIEQGKRAVRVGEAVALAAALELPRWLHLVQDPQSFGHAAEIEAANRRAYTAFEAIKAATAEFLEAQTHIGVSAHVARENGIPVPHVRTAWLDIPAERAVVEARVAYEEQDANLERLNDTVNTIMQALREKGYNPTLDLNDIQTTGGPTS